MSKRLALLKCRCWRVVPASGKCVSFPTPVSNSIGNRMYSLYPGATELCFISTDTRFYAHWRIFIYALSPPFLLNRFDLYASPIMCGIMEGMLDLPISFCNSANEPWLTGQIGRDRGKDINFLLSPACFRETHIQKREPDSFLCIPLLLFVCWHSNIATVLHYAITVSSQQPALANWKRILSSLWTSDDHFRPWHSVSETKGMSRWSKPAL